PVLDQEFGYYDEKAFTFDSTHKWKAGVHEVRIALTPVAPEGKKETIIDLFVNRVTIEGPLEKEHWVATRDYQKFFPRAVPAGKQFHRPVAAGPRRRRHRQQSARHPAA